MGGRNALKRIEKSFIPQSMGAITLVRARNGLAELRMSRIIQEEDLTTQVASPHFVASQSRFAETLLTDEIMWNANLTQLGNFIDIFLARHVSGTYAHHQEHQMLSCSIWLSAPSFWMGGGLESRCVGRM